MKGADLLALVEDWEQVFYQARLADYKDGKKGKVTAVTVELPSGEEVSYAIRVPKSYSVKKGGPYALLLVVPTPGEGPEAHLEAAWNDAAGADTLVAAIGMPEDSGKWRQFNPTGALDGVASIMWTYGDVLGKYAVDVNRVFLAGTGEGTGAALSCAEAFPHLFAGVCGQGAQPKADASNFQNLPTRFVGGGDEADAFAAQAKELGFDNSEAMADGGEADLWAWMEETRRASYPEEVTFSPSNPYSTRAYWLRLDGVDAEAGPRVQATVNREQNSIDIQAERISGVTLYLNDAIVDMERPVKVMVNGSEHEQLLSRNLRTLIDGVHTGGDWGRLFCATMEVSVPADEE